ncbi:MAG: hypothetical protein FJX56_11600, partial [Alphaproteobacteria bacterium]|nr:hypothetical protein [Alphaproteobacteria bacterium]
MNLDLSNLFNALYDRFLLRDVVGKLFPGAVTLFGILALIPASLDKRWRPDIIFSSSEVPNAAYVVAAITSTYVMGLLVQAAGEMVGYHCSTSRPESPFENGDSLEAAFVIHPMHVDTNDARPHGRDR